MTPPLSSSGTQQVVIMMITCGACDDKVGIMTIVDFIYYTHGSVCYISARLGDSA